MNKRAFIGILLALGIPIVSFFMMKYLSDNAIHMPRHYLLDSIKTTVKDGKQKKDSVWHTLANIHLVNQLGDSVDLYSIKNKVIVADLFFTSCGSICPTLTKHMSMMQKSFLKGGGTRMEQDSSNVQFLSFSIDPERDTVAKLKKYADQYGVIHDNWWFLTGNKDSIYNYIFQELKVDKFSDEPINPNFAHTAYFVLIDKNYQVRGYYNGLDTLDALPRLANDIGLLIVEKDKAHPSPLPFDPNTLAIIGIIAALIVLIIMKRIQIKSKKEILEAK